jgi:hypothetical protein
MRPLTPPDRGEDFSAGRAFSALLLNCCHKKQEINTKFEYRNQKQILKSNVQMTETITAQEQYFGGCFDH